jgi:anti-sigma factor RsiW
VTEHMRADLAAYLIGSLDDGERAAVEQHLDGCEACRRELRWLQPAIDLLPESVAQVEAPPQLRERLLAEVGADPGVAPAAPDRRRAAERRGGFLRGFLLRPATGLAALALVAAAVAGYAIAGGGSGSATTTIPGQGPGSLRAALERSGDSGTLKLTGLRQAPSSHVYEAWVQRQQGQVAPVSLFDARHNGTASVSLDHKLDGVQAVMVTVEPRGGSHQPTAPPLISVAAQH